MAIQPSRQPVPKLPIGAAFNAAQPNNMDRYNQYAYDLVGRHR